MRPFADYIIIAVNSHGIEMYDIGVTRHVSHVLYSKIDDNFAI